MYWTGPQAAIEAAEAEAAQIVADIPKTRGGAVLPRSEWAKEHWAVPAEATTAGLWAIPAYPGMATPEGCEAVETVDWPQPEGGV